MARRLAKTAENPPPPPKDLIVLTADYPAKFALNELLQRSQAFGIKPISSDIYVHPEHDPGVLRRSHDFLRFAYKQYCHALVVMDRDGCGSKSDTRVLLEERIEQQLADHGWQGRCAAVVIDPELENWVWSDSPHVEEILGWTGRTPPLREWLQAQGFLKDSGGKPFPPKDAMRAVLRVTRLPPSSAIFAELARTVSFQRCNDAAFLKLSKTLKDWFATS
jgi:hypothetical protein